MKWRVAALVCSLAAAEPPHFILYSLSSGEVVETRWPEQDRPVPLGSLVKPFVALAYGAGHEYRYPEIDCRGDENGCWWPKGHGRARIREAIAHSCNAYFLALAEGVSPADVATWANRFGLSPPPADASVRTLVGFGDAWRSTPLSAVRAYAELLRRGGDPGVRDVLEGMQQAGTFGTGRKAGRDLLVKTGTAPCLHSRPMPGDGYAILLSPARSPRYALLVQLHGSTGANAAGAAAAVTQELRRAGRM